MFPTKLSVIALSAAAAFAMSGCGVTTGSDISFHASGLPHHEHPKQKWWSYQFMYHPHEQVYFEPYTRMYFWNEDGEWIEGERLPSYITINPDYAKVVFLKTPVPHAQHITVVASAGPSIDRHEPSAWPNADSDFALTRASE